MKTARLISDTTLLNFSKRMHPADRIDWARKLDSIGVYEVVMKFATRKELDAISGALTNAKCAAYVRLNPTQLQKTLHMGAGNVHLEIPASYPMIYTAYRKNKDWAKKTLCQCRDLLMESDTNVTLILQDASRAEPYFLETLVQLAAGLKVEKIVAKDLMGIQTLSACAELIASMVAFGYPVGYEGSDRYGLAVANTIQALRTGAVYAGCCLGSLGCGCDLRRLLQTTNRVFNYGIDRKGAEHLDRTFKQTYREERMLRRQNSRIDDRRSR